MGASLHTLTKLVFIFAEARNIYACAFPLRQQTICCFDRTKTEMRQNAVLVLKALLEESTVQLKNRAEISTEKMGSICVILYNWSKQTERTTTPPQQFICHLMSFAYCFNEPIRMTDNFHQISNRYNKYIQ